MATATASNALGPRSWVTAMTTATASKALGPLDAPERHILVRLRLSRIGVAQARRPDLALSVRQGTQGESRDSGFYPGCWRAPSPLALACPAAGRDERREVE